MWSLIVENTKINVGMASIMLCKEMVLIFHVAKFYYKSCFFLQDVSGVILGGCIGHALCTGLAVLAGRVVAAKISARTGIIFYFICFT